MKPKKTSRSYKARLLICLLSLNTLSSCAHTAKKLGALNNPDSVVDIETSEQQQALLNEILKQYNQARTKRIELEKKMNKPSFFCNKKFICITSTASLLAVASGLSVWLYHYLSNPSETNLLGNPMALGSNNETALASRESQLQHNLNTSVSSFIGNVTTTAATVVTTLLPTAGLIAALKSNQSNIHYNSNSVTAAPGFISTDSGMSDVLSDCKSLNIEHPLILTQDVIDYLKAHNFSIKSLECVFAKGLNPNAIDAEMRSILMEVISSIGKLANPLKIVKYLVDKKGANFHKQDDRGNTSLGYAIFYGRKAQSNNDTKTEAKAKSIIDYLEEKGGNPCIKNIIGKPSHSDIELFNNSKLLDKSKKCWVNNIDVASSVKEQDTFITNSRSVG